MTDETTDDDTPRYKTFTRTEARLRPDQVTALGELRRLVAAARTDRGERFTDNTFLRVAVDLLLAHREQLHGNTEAELRASLGIEDDPAEDGGPTS